MMDNRGGLMFIEHKIKPQKEGIFYNEKTKRFIIRKKNESGNKYMIPYITVMQFKTIEEAEKYCLENEI